MVERSGAKEFYCTPIKENPQLTGTNIGRLGCNQNYSQLPNKRGSLENFKNEKNTTDKHRLGHPKTMWTRIGGQLNVHQMSRDLLYLPRKIAFYVHSKG